MMEEGQNQGKRKKKCRDCVMIVVVEVKLYKRVKGQRCREGKVARRLRRMEKALKMLDLLYARSLDD